MRKGRNKKSERTRIYMGDKKAGLDKHITQGKLKIHTLLSTKSICYYNCLHASSQAFVSSAKSFLCYLHRRRRKIERCDVINDLRKVLESAPTFVRALFFKYKYTFEGRAPYCVFWPESGKYELYSNVLHCGDIFTNYACPFRGNAWLISKRRALSLCYFNQKLVGMNCFGTVAELCNDFYEFCIPNFEYFIVVVSMSALCLTACPQCSVCFGWCEHALQLSL